MLKYVADQIGGASEKFALVRSPRRDIGRNSGGDDMRRRCSNSQFACRYVSEAISGGFSRLVIVDFFLC
ncbi:hypothetical protein [Rhizobium binae]|uniref:hypothetical protein n=1 Tax=Rhizobium binae TaxID=1138190 RepID=UPI001C830521|nr:hypothetical protein [Rhizobium binae]MBX4971031.1 hypothetical protein [Rhizobium binae]